MKSITITLEKPLEEAVREAAASRDESISAIVRDAIADYLEWGNRPQSSAVSNDRAEASSK
jgi:predicted transcriptional regulator